jgi:hypothetical protein
MLIYSDDMLEIPNDTIFVQGDIPARDLQSISQASLNKGKNKA